MHLAMPSIPQWLRDRPRLVRHTAVILALLLATFAIARSSFQYGETRAIYIRSVLMPGERNDFCLDFRKNFEAISGSPASAASEIAIGTRLIPGIETYAATDIERTRVIFQAAKAQRLECLHAEGLSMYLGNYYMAIVTAMTLGAISAIALLLVGPKGWMNANEYLVNVLLISGAIAAYFSGFPGVFQQPQMIGAHRAQILRYEALLDGMASHVANARLVPAICAGVGATVHSRVREESFPPVEFIGCIDAALARSDLPFAMDPTQGPDYQKILGPNPH